MEITIPIADLQSVYSVAAVDRALEDGSSRLNEGLKGWYGRMRELGGTRFIIKPSTTAAVNDLCEKSPNFVNVVDDLTICGSRLHYRLPAMKRCSSRQCCFWAHRV